MALWNNRILSESVAKNNSNWMLKTILKSCLQFVRILLFDPSPWWKNLRRKIEIVYLSLNRISDSSSFYHVKYSIQFNFNLITHELKWLLISLTKWHLQISSSLECKLSQFKLSHLFDSFLLSQQFSIESLVETDWYCHFTETSKHAEYNNLFRIKQVASNRMTHFVLWIMSLKRLHKRLHKMSSDKWLKMDKYEE